MLSPAAAQGPSCLAADFELSVIQGVKYHGFA